MNFLKIRAVASSMSTEDIVHFASFNHMLLGMPKLTPMMIVQCVGKNLDWGYGVINGQVALNANERACLLAGYLQLAIEAGFLDLLEEFEG